MLRKLLLLIVLLLAGCIKVPEGVSVIDGFALQRYLGTWYEIARIENSFEKNFTSVTATYTSNNDGSVDVLNRGFDAKKGEWKDTAGKAKFVGEENRGELKVSFFGPFFSSYNIVALDKEEYSWAIVCGYKKSLFWILSRNPVMEPALYDELVRKADSLGFDTGNLVVNKAFDAEGR
ncbi:MAG: lipocalin [Prosthecochloris sp.]|nr:lipocalin [Prosthecochloris sp.]